MKFILGTKQGMTQIFRPDGTVVPVTRIQAGPCVVTQVKTIENDGVHSLQIGFGEQKKFRLNQAAQGHLKNLTPVRYIREINVHDEPMSLERGDTFSVKIFSPGEKVQVVGWSKGKGFQGVVKRHGFRGGPKTHGHKDNLRMPGTIGAGGVQRVFKNVRMGGHMGAERVTVKNLEIVAVDVEKGELFLKGAVPGARGGLLLLSTMNGTIEVDIPQEVVPVSVPEAEEAMQSPIAA